MKHNDVYPELTAMQDGLPECSPLCKGLRCDKHPSAYKMLTGGGRRSVQCTWAEDECEGPYCKFGLCMERKMTSDGRCGRVIRHEEEGSDEAPHDLFDPEHDVPIPERFAKKLRRKGSLS